MNLEARKVEFVQEFLKLQSEEAVSRLEKILRKEKKASAHGFERELISCSRKSTGRSKDVVWRVTVQTKSGTTSSRPEVARSCDTKWRTSFPSASHAT